MFDHFVFSDPRRSMGHLAPEHRGLLGPPSPPRTQEVRSVLIQALSKPS